MVFASVCSCMLGRSTTVLAFRSEFQMRDLPSLLAVQLPAELVCDACIVVYLRHIGAKLELCVSFSNLCFEAVFIGLAVTFFFQGALTH